MTRAKHLPASARKGCNYFAAFTASVFLMVVVESIPAWIQVETASESANKSPFINTNTGTEKIVPAFSTMSLKFWQFEVSEGIAVILWDEAGKDKNPPARKQKAHDTLYNGHIFVMNKFNAKKTKTT